MNQKYTMAFSNNTNFTTTKIAGFSICFASIFKIIFHNFGERIIILYLPFVSLKESTI